MAAVVTALDDTVLVYCTYNVAGSEPDAATTSITLATTPDVAPVNDVPTKLAVSVGNVFVVVFNLINSYFGLRLTPPGRMTAPSL